MSDRFHQNCVNTFLTVNSCAWPWVFGGVALWRGNIDGLWNQVSIGVCVGGGIFLLAAAMRWMVTPVSAGADAEPGFLRHVPSAGRFVGAAAIMLLLGSAGLVAERLAPRPPIHRFNRA